MVVYDMGGSDIEVRRWYQIPQSWSCRTLSAPGHCCWEQNSSPPEEQQMLPKHRVNLSSARHSFKKVFMIIIHIITECYLCANQPFL